MYYKKNGRKTKEMSAILLLEIEFHSTMISYLQVQM